MNSTFSFVLKIHLSAQLAIDRTFHYKGYLTHCQLAEILPIGHKTATNQSISQLIWLFSDFQKLKSLKFLTSFSDFQEPYAIVVLLQYDLVVVDLTSPNYPCFENPYPMDIHESPVTACQYYANCPPDLIPAFYSVGSSRQKRTGFSEKVIYLLTMVYCCLGFFFFTLSSDKTYLCC